MRFFLAFFAITVCSMTVSSGFTVQQPQPQPQTITQNRRWFGTSLVPFSQPAIQCPTIVPDFSFLDANKNLCHQDLIFDAFFVHNTTGDFALVPTVYKAKKFTMHQPLGVTVNPACTGIDEEVFCVFTNKTAFIDSGIKISLLPAVTLVKDSCNRQVVEKCKSTWELSGVMPQVQSCPKVLSEYPPLEESKFLCDHEYIIESLFIHNETGEYALVHQNHKAVRALLTPTTRIPVLIPDSCKSTIDEELFCIFANSRDFTTGTASGALKLSSQITLIKKPCNLALVNKCFTGNWDFGRRRSGGGRVVKVVA